MGVLVDQFGRPFPSSKRPETRELGVVSIRDRWSSYPSAGLTPPRLAAIFQAADVGDVYRQAELFEEMEEKDGHLLSVMQTRRLAVLGLESQVEAASDAPEDAKIADFCREHLEDLELDALMTHLLGAIGHGYGGAEILWQSGASALIKGFQLIHPKNLTFIDSLTPKVVTEENRMGVEPRPFQLVYHRYAARSGHDTRNGLLRVVAYMFLFKNFALKDWVTFNEIFGMPLRLGKYDPSASKEDIAALKDAIRSLGSDAAGVISKSTEIEFVEAAGRLTGSYNPYEVMADFCNREMSKAVLGQTLTTDTKGSTGTYAAGKVQADVRRDLVEADAKAIAKTIRLQLLRPLVGYNFGWDKKVPGFTLLIQDAPDLKEDSEVVKNLKEAGFGKRIPLRYANEHFGIPEPKEGEETLGDAPEPPEPGAERGSQAGKPAPPGTGEAAAMKLLLPLFAGLAGRDVRTAAPLTLIPQDAQVIRTQGELDHLTLAALEASAQADAQMLAPVLELLERGASLEEIRSRLLTLYPELAAGGQEEALYQAMVQANLRGRLGHEQ
ncbi:MAG: DUF935 domain-containing protein [Deltaproteobacteria bacterium]|nr:MAG: DUF935 domain-containing protein [Deltaproteobacteria bacterium]